MPIWMNSAPSSARDEAQRMEDVGEAGQRGADEHRRDRRGQRARARRHQPDPEPLIVGLSRSRPRVYGRRGNFVKSGWRFSR